MFRRASLLTLLAPLFVLVMASPAAAAATFKTDVSSSGSGLLEDCGGGVTLDEAFTEDATVTHYLDNSGNVTRLVLHAQLRGVITNSASGNTYSDVAYFSAQLDPSGVTTYRGLTYNIIVRGQGPVIQDIGRIVFSEHGGTDIIFEAGPHMVSDGTAPDPCSVLL